MSKYKNHILNNQKHPSTFIKNEKKKIHLSAIFHDQKANLLKITNTNRNLMH